MSEEEEELKVQTSMIELTSFSFMDYQKELNFEVVKLDSLQNFDELIYQMRKLSCEEKIIGLEFNLNDTIYKLTGWTECPSSMVSSCYFNRNIIIIKNDSLLNLSGNWDGMVHINDLGKELTYISSKKYFRYQRDILNPALIHLYIDKRFTISKTKEVLQEITKEFKKINSEKGKDYFEYNILFERYSWLDIPPPPPPPPKMIN